MSMKHRKQKNFQKIPEKLLQNKILFDITFAKRNNIRIFKGSTMKKKNWHNLGKTDMLTLLYEQEKQIQQLTEEVENLKNQLEDRTIKMKEAGSIAEASLKINKIFEVAQQAADEYLKSIKKLNKTSYNVRNQKIYRYKVIKRSKKI